MRKLPAYILENLRQRRGLEPTDNSEDEAFENMEIEEIVEEYLAWEGIIGWGNTVVNLVEDLQECVYKY